MGNDALQVLIDAIMESHRLNDKNLEAEEKAIAASKVKREAYDELIGAESAESVAVKNLTVVAKAEHGEVYDSSEARDVIYACKVATSARVTFEAVESAEAEAIAAANIHYGAVLDQHAVIDKAIKALGEEGVGEDDATDCADGRVA